MSAVVENRVTLLGHLGQDVDFRDLGGGKKMARFSIATNEFRNGNGGQAEKQTTWHNIIAWGDMASSMNEKLRKGTKVLVEGKLSYRQYENKAGEKRQQTEIVATSFRKLDKNEKES